MAADKSTAGRGALPDQAAQAVQSPEISQNKPSAAAQADTQAARPGCQPAQEDTRAAQTSAPVETAGPAAGAPAGTSGMPVPAGQSAPAHNPAMPLPEQGAGPAAPVPAQGAQAKTPAQANATQQAVRQLMTMLRPVPSLFEPSMRGKDVLPDDLPYAAEVQAALARRPSRGARVLSFGVMLFFAGFIFWASIATLDEVTHAEGQIIPSSRTQIIQNLEGGILSEVLVDEGQIVEKGAVMARIDNELAASSLRDAMNKAIENYTALCRLRAILKGEEKLVWPVDIVAALAETCGQVPTGDQLFQLESMQRVQANIFLTQTRQRASELNVLNDRVEQRESEVEQLKANLDHQERSLKIITEQLAMAGPLVSRGSYSRVQYLDMQDRSVRVQGEIAQLKASLPKAEVAAREARHRLELRRAEMDSELMEEASKRTVELVTQREMLSAGSDRVVRTELKAPVRGTVKKIYLNTLGGVVKPGEPIMELVPLDDTLLVEARVKPQDVAFLHPGLPAMVKITAYDFSIYGGLKGTLEQISADTIEDREGGFYYLVKIRTKETAITHNREVLPIIPGMMATADIMTGKKTVLDYLLKPILKAKQNAMREK